MAGEEIVASRLWGRFGNLGILFSLLLSKIGFGFNHQSFQRVTPPPGGLEDPPRLKPHYCDAVAGEWIRRADLNYVVLLDPVVCGGRSHRFVAGGKGLERQ